MFLSITVRTNAVTPTDVEDLIILNGTINRRGNLEQRRVLLDHTKKPVEMAIKGQPEFVYEVVRELQSKAFIDADDILAAAIDLWAASQTEPDPDRADHIDFLHRDLKARAHELGNHPTTVELRAERGATPRFLHPPYGGSKR